jgi:hypothetical protein
MKRHQLEVVELFGLAKAKLPSYSTLRDMVQHIDALKVAEVFMGWAKQALPVEAGQVVSLDGKALASTVKECYGTQQDFVMVVSACVQQWDGVIGQLSLHNGDSSEITSVRQLLQQLDVQGVWVTLDALHTQKHSL